MNQVLEKQNDHLLSGDQLTEKVYQAFERKSKKHEARSFCIFKDSGKISLLVAIFFMLFLSCKNNGQTNHKIDSNENIDGVYTAEIDRVVTTFTISGNMWYGEHRDESTGSIVGSGTGTIEEKKIFDENGTELGYISNGKVHVNIGGVSMILDKE